MEFLLLFGNTLLLRPYVFVFLGASFYTGTKLLGWRRTGRLLGLTWATAFVCEYASTRIGFPFGDYYYTGSTQTQELYISNIPFMDSLSFSFLLFAGYCMALVFVLPSVRVGKQQGWLFDPALRISWPVIGLTVMFFTFLDVVIDPVALQGERWFLGQIYGYPEEAIYFGVPLANFAGWAIVGMLSLLAYRWLEQGPYATEPIPREVVKWELLSGIGLYYGVLAFNLIVTFWIGEWLMGLVGYFIFFPLTVILLVILWRGLSCPDIQSYSIRQSLSK